MNQFTTRQWFNRKIEALEPDDIPRAAEEYRETVTEPFRAAIEISRLMNDPARLRARRFLVAVDELAIGTLVDAEIVEGPALVWLLEQAVDAELRLRRRLHKRIDMLLDDKTLLPQAAGTVRSSEEEMPSMRVCDSAYLMMRRLIHLEEDRLKYQVESKIFLHAPERLRDKEINEARRTDRWNRLLMEDE